MSNQILAAEQLLELLLTLKKTTPAAAKGILNAQPTIAYALITLMVSMHAINFEVFQKTLAEYGAAQASAAVAPQPSIPAATAPTPPYLRSQYPTATSSGNAYTDGQSSPARPPPALYGQPSGVGHGYQQHSYLPYGGQVPAQPASHGGVSSDPLAAIPQDQKELIMRVISMTPEQINVLPPSERTAFIQIRSTLGIPS